MLRMVFFLVFALTISLGGAAQASANGRFRPGDRIGGREMLNHDHYMYKSHYRPAYDRGGADGESRPGRKDLGQHDNNTPPAVRVPSMILIGHVAEPSMTNNPARSIARQRGGAHGK